MSTPETGFSSPISVPNAKKVASSRVAVAAAVLHAPAELCVPVRRIVTFHSSGLSDLLFTLPSLQALRESFPGAVITSVVRESLSGLLQSSPFVDDLLIRPRGGLPVQAKLMKALHDRHFDIALAFSGTRKTILLVWSTGAPVRAGFETAKIEALLTHHVPVEGAPCIETHLDLVKCVGARPHQLDYGGLLHLGPEYSQHADALLEEHDIGHPFIVVACRSGDKQGLHDWTAPQWIAALEELAERWPVVLAGTTAAVSITAGMRPRRHPVIDLGGRMELPTIAAMCGKAALFCGSDAGLMHLSAAMKTPAVGLFDTADTRLAEPRGVPYRLLNLTDLQPATVALAARELIGV